MSLRLRLTLWYSAVLAGVLLLFGIAVYSILVASLVYQVDQTIRTAARDIILASSISRVQGGENVTIPRLDRFGVASLYAQAWKTNGELVTQSDSLGQLKEALDPAGLAAGEQKARSVYAQGVHLRVFTTPILTNDGRIVGYLQTASLLQPIDDARNALLIVLVAGGILAVILAALIGWLSAGRALSPLETITQTALQITRADDLSKRIPLAAASHDEVGQLIMAFNESLERLERLFNSQRRFMADVSHELRTPLTAVRGNVDLLRRMGCADNESLDAIQSEAERMNRLVGDLLLLAQADSGHLPLAHERIELDTLLLEAVRDARVLARHVNLTVGEIDQAAVIGDRDRLKQVLINLVSNAIKYTPEAGQVTLSLQLVQNWARLTVTDTGIGILPEHLPHLFDRFYRVDKARSRAEGGAGLGLSIAQRIAVLHGGRIEATSTGTAGQGSTFSLWLPLAPQPAAPQAATTNLARSSPN